MNQNNPNSLPRSSLAATNSQLEHEEDGEEEFLKQNQMISQEIWKSDKSLNCPTRTFKLLALFSLYAFVDSLTAFLRGNTRSSFTFLPGFAFYSLFFISFILNSAEMWAFFRIWRVKNSRNASKLKTPILIFKTFLCFAVCFKLPIFLYYLTPFDLNNGFFAFFFGVIRPVSDIIISGSCLLVAIRIRNILIKNKPFYEASSFYVQMA